MWISRVTLIGVTLLGCGAHAAPPPPATTGAPDPTAARDLAAMARSGLEAHHPREAALLFDRAFDAEPHPLWQLAAGSAWLEALEPELAGERLAAAAASPALDDAASHRAAELLGVARRLTPLVARATEALAAGDAERAMTAWEEVFRILPIGRALVLAAKAAEAARPEEAARLFSAAAARPDLSTEDARVVADGVERSRNRPMPAAGSGLDAAWWVVASGGLVVVTGLVALGVGAGYDADLAAIKRTAVDGVVRDTTRRDAADLQERAAAWTTIGWVGLGTGLVAAALGTGMVLGRGAQPQTGVRIEATLGPNGWHVGAVTRF